MKVNSKTKIVSLLKSKETPVSGEDISNKIGISRTAVWKNIKKLIDEGYTITSSSKGYILKQEEDLLIPYEFIEESNLYIYKKQTESTMNVARELVEKGKAVNGTIVIADEQTEGKAKFNRTFSSPKGGLYFTIIFIPDCRPVMDVNLYSMAALIAVNKTLKDELKLDITSRWPFETWLDQNKISGILPEYKIENNKVKWINLGIGINIGDKIPRKKLLIDIKERMLKYLESEVSLVEQYTKTLNLTGRSFVFNTEGTKLKGKVININRLGTVSIDTGKTLEYAYIGDSNQEEEI